MRRLMILLSPALLIAVAGAAPIKSGIQKGVPGSGKPDPRALGALGGEGVPLTAAQLEKDRLSRRMKAIRVTSLRSDGQGEKAGLQVGDVIVGAGGEPLARGQESPFLVLTAYIEKPRGNDEPAVLDVLRDHHLKKIDVTIPGVVRRRSARSKTDPQCRAILKKSLARLAQMQSEDGSFPTKLGGVNGQVAVTTIAGLAFLASGSTPTSGPYSKQIREVTKYLVAHAGLENPAMGHMAGKNWSQVNWSLGYAPLFLARIYAMHPAPELKKKLTFIRDHLVKNMMSSGGWAHGPADGLPYPLGYAELVAVGNLCLASLGEIRSVGIPVPMKVIVKAVEYTESTSDGAGGVGYSARPGQKGYGCAGRSAGALFAMSRCGITHRPFYRRLCSYLRRNLAEIPHGHVSPCYHMFFGALACRVLGKRDWRRFMKTFRLTILSVWNGDGTFGVRPADTSEAGLPNTDRAMGPAWRTATYTMILALPSGLLDRPAGSLMKTKKPGVR